MSEESGWAPPLPDDLLRSQAAGGPGPASAAVGGGPAAPAPLGPGEHQSARPAVADAEISAALEGGDLDLAVKLRGEQRGLQEISTEEFRKKLGFWTADDPEASDEFAAGSYNNPFCTLRMTVYDGLTLQGLQATGGPRPPAGTRAYGVALGWLDDAVSHSGDPRAPRDTVRQDSRPSAAENADYFGKLLTEVDERVEGAFNAAVVARVGDMVTYTDPRSGRRFIIAFPPELLETGGSVQAEYSEARRSVLADAGYVEIGGPSPGEQAYPPAAQAAPSMPQAGPAELPQGQQYQQPALPAVYQQQPGGTPPGGWVWSQAHNGWVFHPGAQPGVAARPATPGRLQTASTAAAAKAKVWAGSAVEAGKGGLGRFQEWAGSAAEVGRGGLDRFEGVREYAGRTWKFINDPEVRDTLEEIVIPAINSIGVVKIVEKGGARRVRRAGSTELVKLAAGTVGATATGHIPALLLRKLTAATVVGTEAFMRLSDDKKEGLLRNLAKHELIPGGADDFVLAVGDKWQRLTPRQQERVLKGIKTGAAIATMQRKKKKS